MSHLMHENVYLLKIQRNFFQEHLRGSSLFYNTSARHERHKRDTNDLVRHECDTIATKMTQVRHKCYTNVTIATRVKNFDVDKDTSENIFSHSYISYMANERLQGEEQFHSKNYLFEMPRSHAKMHLKSASQKTELCNGKSYIKMLHTRLQLQMPLHVPAQLRIVTQPRF